MIYILIRAMLLRCYSLVIDIFFLMKQPSLIKKYILIVTSFIQSSPYAAGGFAQINKTRKYKLSYKSMTYGETPFSTALKILSKINTEKHHSFIDLGCGRGKVLLAALSFGWKVTGVELLSRHIQIVNDVFLGDISLLAVNWLTINLKHFDIVYVTWTCIPEKERELLNDKFNTELVKDAKLITVSFPVSNVKHFKLLSCKKEVFSWGFADVYTYLCIND